MVVFLTEFTSPYSLTWHLIFWASHRMAGHQRVKVHKEPESVHFKNDSPGVSKQIQAGHYTGVLGGGKVMPQLQPVAQTWNCATPYYTRQYRSVIIQGIARSKRDGTRAETRFGLSAKWTSTFKSVGVSVQSTTGSRGVRISGQQLYRPCSEVQCKAAGYPLHLHLSPSLPLPYVTVCHQVPNALC